MLWLPDAVWGIVFWRHVCCQKAADKLHARNHLPNFAKQAFHLGLGGAVPTGRRLTDRGWLCPKPSDVGRGWAPHHRCPPYTPLRMPSLRYSPLTPHFSPQVVWGLNKGNHRRYLLEGLFAEVGQVIACMKSVSFLTPDMASKNDAIYGIV